MKIESSLHRFSWLFISIMLVLSTAFLVGCSVQGNGSSKNTSNESGYEEAVFQGICFDIPKNVELQVEHDTSAMYGLDEKAKNPYALTIYWEYAPGEKTTARSWYQTFSEFEDCELVTANGIEICVQTDFAYSTISLHFSYNGAFYSAMISYDDGTKSEYKEYAKNFYKSIRAASGSASNKESVKSSSNVPDGAVEWSKASQYVGKTATFYGKVVDAEYASTSNSSPTFLDLGAAYPDPNRLSVVIWGKNRKNFSSAPENAYKGKTIAVTGEIYRYDGVCNIEISSPKQIEVLD
ncbi:hypothetical protein [Anaerotardibacter muris]|uniref:hypothetical protein n=1 Tax=Anaerotardibacter muris TaxID=2941505 RepID=UPI00203E5599|nr:hypothetical protein [Anaerotardibacter muris]